MLTSTLAARSRSPVSARARCQRASLNSASARALSSSTRSTMAFPVGTARRSKSSSCAPTASPRSRSPRSPVATRATRASSSLRPSRCVPRSLFPPRPTSSSRSTPVEVSDDDVEERLTALRQRFGTLVAVERAAEDGDFVTIDLTATIEGEQIDAVQGSSYQVGTGNMIDGLDDAVTGLAAGGSATLRRPARRGRLRWRSRRHRR